MKKIISSVLLAGLVGTGGFFLYRHLKGPGGPSAAAQLPPDTMLYSGCGRHMAMGAALSLSDFSEDLQKIGLSTEESQVLDQWLNQLRGVHVGLLSVSIVPFSLDAVAILEGNVSVPLMAALPKQIAAGFTPGTPYRKVTIHTMIIPVNPMMQLELLVTDPVLNRTFIALSRTALHGTIDRLFDGGPSLADTPDFSELTSLSEIKRKDVISYMNLNAYFNMLLGLCNMMPMPVVREGAQIVRDELRLDEWGPAVSGQSILNSGRSISLCKFPADMPLYRELEFSQPAGLSRAPAKVYQAMSLQVADVIRTRKTLCAFIVRVMQRTKPLMPMADLPADPVATLEQIIGFSLNELDPLLTGSFGMWQSVAPHIPEGMAQVIQIGIADADAASEFIDEKILSFTRLQPVEEDGIWVLPGTNSFAWALLPDNLLLSSDPATLRTAVRPGAELLTDSPDYQALRKQLPSKMSWIQYANYTDVLTANKQMPQALVPVMKLVEGMTSISGGVAENGMLRSESITKHDISTDDIRAAISALLQTL